MTDFRVGDRCYVFGGPKAREDGTNGRISDTDSYAGIVVEDDLRRMHFQSMATEEPIVFHRKPDFKIPDRPKRKVTKTVEAWAIVCPRTNRVQHVYPPEEKQYAIEAMGYRYSTNTDVLVHLTGTYEVEE